MARLNRRSRRGRSALVLAGLLLCCWALLTVFRGGVDVSPRGCWSDPGGDIGSFFGNFFKEKDNGSASPEARALLEDRNFQASPKAIVDLKAGIVDPRLVATLQTVAREHRICVDTFKEGHSFLPGVKDGPSIPDGYGEAGGLPNTHYYGRAADVRKVDDKPVRGNGTDPNVLDIGEIFAGIPPQQRPDQIIGPPSWTKALDRSRAEGWILDDDQTKLHEDHLHIGYTEDDGTANTR